MEGRRYGRREEGMEGGKEGELSYKYIENISPTLSAHTPAR